VEIAVGSSGDSVTRASNNNIAKVNVKVTVEQATKAQRRNRGIALFFL
jgi:hypothetical protein